MTSFESWFAELISEQRWYEQLQMNCKGKDIKGACNKVYTDALADSSKFAAKPMSEHRRHVANILWKMPVEKVEWWKVQKVDEPVKQETDEKPLTGEERQKKLNEWLQSIQEAPMMKIPPKMSYAELAEMGGVRRPKEKPYPTSSPEEIRIRERHLAYVRYCYEPVTGKPNSNWMEESDFDQLFDAGLID